MAGGLIDEPRAWKNEEDPDNPGESIQKLRVYFESTSGGSTLRCIKDVINLVAGTPTTLTFSSIASICSHEFCDSVGNVIYLSTEITANQITICSKQNLSNILYRIIGE